MELTLFQMSRWFDEFNRRYFGSVLVKPSFRITKHKSYFGRYWYRRSYNRIDMSVYFKRSERDYQQTFLHEMIHCYIDQQDIRDTSSHGVEFKRIASYINRDGWNIKRTSSLDNCVLNEVDKKACYVLHYRYNNIDYLAYVAKGSVHKINGWYKSGLYSRSLKFVGWYYGYSDKFSLIRKSVSRLHGLPYSSDYMVGLKEIKIE